MENPHNITKDTKLIFLDVDGVINNRATFQRSHHGFIGFDPFMVLLVHRIIEATGAKVVLSSSWRHGEESRKEVMGAVPFIDYTPSCCTGIRGAEIYAWMSRNIPHDIKESVKYAILDDESDMLLWQKDNFFQTTFDTGLTEEVAQKVITHLNR